MRLWFCINSQICNIYWVCEFIQGYSAYTLWEFHYNATLSKIFENIDIVWECLYMREFIYIVRVSKPWECVYNASVLRM